jgi:UDP-4-amino-4,6-dideoxy-N-acetyl-beta-L-altrosamine N-acetyltransferase
MDYKLLPILSLDKDSQLRVLSIRNEDAIRKWMYTDHLISEDEHFAWISRLKGNDKQKVFAILENSLEPVGVISVTDIDAKHKKASWAFYISTEHQGTGLGAALELQFINYCFDILFLEKLNCEVIEGNTSVIKLHKRFLFREEGYLRKNIIKNDERVGVYLFGLLKEDWQMNKNEIREKYNGMLSQYQISIGEGDK